MLVNFLSTGVKLLVELTEFQKQITNTTYLEQEACLRLQGLFQVTEVIDLF